MTIPRDLPIGRYLAQNKSLKPATTSLAPSKDFSEIPEDQIEVLKENLPIVRKFIPSEARAPLGKPFIFTQDINVPVMGTGAYWLHQLGLTGKNMAAAVVDSGVAAVPELKDSLVASYRMKNGTPVPAIPGDVLGHGTACAGWIKSMAPDAKIVSMQVANEHGGANYTDLPEAIRFLVRNKDSFKDDQGNPVPLKVINISMGFPEFLPTKDDPLDRAVKEAWSKGIAVVVAAGNDGPEPGTIVSAPADEPSIITVGAVDDKGVPDRTKAGLAEFSSRGPTPEGAELPTVIAPGANVASINVPGSVFDRTARAAQAIRDMKDEDLYQVLLKDDELREDFEVPVEMLAVLTPHEVHQEINKRLPSLQLINDYTIALSGTSFASPITAGGILPLLEWSVSHGKDASPDSVKRLLQQSADKLPGVSDSDQGAGYINLKKAYDFLQKNP